MKKSVAKLFVLRFHGLAGELFSFFLLSSINKGTANETSFCTFQTNFEASAERGLRANIMRVASS
jgi:hypothetical protein